MKLYIFSTGYFSIRGRLLRSDKTWKEEKMPMTCFLLEDVNGLTLIDTGLGSTTIKSPGDFPGYLKTLALSIHIKEGEDALSRVKSLGYESDDVKNIILTHLHLDHVGGLSDFPTATVHVSRAEYDTVIKDKNNFFSFYHNGAFKHKPKWQIHEMENQERFGFSHSCDLFENGNVVLVATPGHSNGHMGVAVTVGNNTFVHLGDAALYEEQIKNPSVVAFGTKIFRWAANSSSEEEKKTRKKIGDICSNNPGLTIIYSHDAWKYKDFPIFPKPLALSSDKVQ